MRDSIRTKASFTEFNYAFLSDANTTLWHTQKSVPQGYKYENRSNFDQCSETVPCYQTLLVSTMNATVKDKPSSMATVHQLTYFVEVILRKDSPADVSNVYSFLLTYSNYLDMFAMIVVVGIVFFINTRLTSRAYYVIFSQINLFTHKLDHYTGSMLKPSELPKFSIDDLLFPEASEISDFFIEFFEQFQTNSAEKNNSFDMTDSVEKITSQLKKTIKFRKKFDENVGEILMRMTLKTKTFVQSKNPHSLTRLG